jgi:hypothetical protein
MIRLAGTVDLEALLDLAESMIPWQSIAGASTLALPATQAR